MLQIVKVRSKRVTGIYGKEGFKFYFLNVWLQVTVYD